MKRGELQPCSFAAPQGVVRTPRVLQQALPWYTLVPASSPAPEHACAPWWQPYSSSFGPRGSPLVVRACCCCRCSVSGPSLGGGRPIIMLQRGGVAQGGRAPARVGVGLAGRNTANCAWGLASLPYRPTQHVETLKKSRRYRHTLVTLNHTNLWCAHPHRRNTATRRQSTAISLTNTTKST